MKTIYDTTVNYLSLGVEWIHINQLFQNQMHIKGRVWQKQGLK